MLQDGSLAAKIGFDTAENEPSKVSVTRFYYVDCLFIAQECVSLAAFRERTDSMLQTDAIDCTNRKERNG